MTHHGVAMAMAGTAGGAIYAAWVTGVAIAQANGGPADKLTEFGIAGSLMAVIIYIVYLLLNKTLAGRETDLGWHREELTRKSQLFQQVLENQSSFNEKNMGHLIDKFSVGLEKIDQRLAMRTEDLLKILETMRSVNEVLNETREVLGHCHEVQQLRLKMEATKKND